MGNKGTRSLKFSREVKVPPKMKPSGTEAPNPDYKINEKNFFSPVIEEIEKVNLDESIEFIKNITPDKMDIHKIKLLSRPIIKVENGMVYLISLETRESRQIGISNRRSGILIPLSKDPASMVDESMAVSLSSLAPKLKSSSPSMMYHQTASVALLKTIMQDTVFEEPGPYTPDLCINSMGNKIYVDICSDFRLKYADLENKGILRLGDFLIISKYDIIGSSEGDSGCLRFLSRMNDKRDMDYAFSRAERLSKFNNVEMSYSVNLLNFFSNHKDTKHRSLATHHRYALKSYMEILEEEKREEALPDYRTELYELGERLIKRSTIMKDGGKNFENDIYIFPKQPESEIDESFFPPEINITNEGGLLKFNLNEEVDNSVNQGGHKLYELLEGELRVPERTILANLTYAEDKTNHDLNDIGAIKLLLEKYRNADKAYYALVVASRIKSHTNYDFNDDGELEYKIRDLTPNKGLMGAKLLKTDKLTLFSTLTGRQPIDPEHSVLIKREQADQVQEFLRTSRDYHELRFRRRVSIAIQYVKKPEKLFRVKHHSIPELYAECVIKGLIFEKDKGVVLVSFFSNGNLYRTEKWRLEDVTNYSVGVDRLVNLLIAINKDVKDYNTIMKAGNLYSRLISENSWGNSNVFKAYRYLAAGVCMGSPKVVNQIEVFEKTLGNSSNSKMSLFLLGNYLLSYKGEFKTPALGLDFAQLSYEIFLVSLCPVDQYGTKRHLVKAIGDLYSEINLYDSSGALELIRDFEKDILESNNRDLGTDYKNYLLKVKEFSKRTGGRFTWTPAVTVLLYEDINDLKINPINVQETCPTLSELLTLKASHSTHPPFVGKALSCISMTAKEYGTTSVSLLNSRIINKSGLQDLGMRLFPKYDDFSNREISILSAEYRIIQYCSESFFKKICEMNEDITVHSKDKRELIYKDMEICKDSDKTLFNIIDQKKWGPNNNTLNFATIGFVLGSRTTEAYLSSISLLMMEFKVFEVPPWLPQFYKEINASYGIVGKLGRSHMGLGICQNSSSVYSALMLRLFHRINKLQMSRIPRFDELIYNFNSMAESDDGTTSFSVSLPSYTDESGVRNLVKDDAGIASLTTIRDECFNIYLNNSMKLDYFYMFLGTLTSNYKNIISTNYREYCSIYVSKDGIARNDIKYLCSLLIPQTTGNFLHDYRKCVDSFNDSINSGCSIRNAGIIASSNLLKLFRQWKLDSRILELPDNNTLSLGLPRVRNVVNTDFFSLRTPNHLKFDHRDGIRGEIGDDGLKSLLVSLKIGKISKSREASSYRSILSYGDAKTDMIATSSPYYQRLGCYGETCESFLYHSIRNPYHFNLSINQAYDVIIPSEISTRTAKGNFFRSMRFRVSQLDNVDIFSAVANSYDPVMTVNDQSTDEELLLHIMRDRRVGTIIDFTPVEKLDLLSRFEYFDNLLFEEQEKSGTSTHWYTSVNDELESYTRQTFLISSSVIKVDTTLKFKGCLSYIPDLPYYTSVNSTIYNLYYDSNGRFSKGNMSGRAAFKGKLIDGIIEEPDMSSLLRYADTRIFRSNEKYIETVLKGDDCYLNFWVSDEDEIDKDNNLDESFFQKPDFEIDPDELGDLANLPISLQLEVGEPSSEEDDDGLKGLLPGGVYKSCRVSPTFLSFSEGYMRKDLIANYYVINLIRQGGLKTFPPIADGFIIHDLSRTKCQIYDDKIPRKIEQLILELDTKLRLEQGTITNEWAKLAYKSVSNFNEVELLGIGSCFLIPDNRIQFSRKPIGKKISKVEMRRLIRNEFENV